MAWINVSRISKNERTVPREKKRIEVKEKKNNNTENEKKKYVRKRV